MENQRPRSTSGNSIIRPERGGHSSWHRLLVSLAGSQSPSKGPCDDYLSTCLFDCAKLREWPLRSKAGLLLKFAPCSLQRIFPFPIFSFRKRPCTFVLLRPERAAGMDEKDLQLPFPPSIHHQTRTTLWHLGSCQQANCKRGGFQSGASTSEDELSCKLNRAGVIEGTRGCYRTEIAGGDWIGWIEALLDFRVRVAGAGMVEEIPCLGTELELQVLPDVEAFEQREVDIAESGAMDRISP